MVLDFLAINIIDNEKIKLKMSFLRLYDLVHFYSCKYFYENLFG